MEGPPLSSPRSSHCSCVIKSEDGTDDCIILIGGCYPAYPRDILDTTEIFSIKEKTWSQGPKLPIKLTDSACVALPPTTKYSCLVIVGKGEYDAQTSSEIYGLNRSLTAWSFLGTVGKRCGHIALPLS